MNVTSVLFGMAIGAAAMLVLCLVAFDIGWRWAVRESNKSDPWYDRVEKSWRTRK